MKEPTTTDETIPRPQSARAWCRARGISPVTLWRYQKRGWIKTFKICGKLYVDLRSVEAFDCLAITGAFASPPHGAAAASHSKANADRKDQDCAVEPTALN
jgi:hypothetical protein